MTESEAQQVLDAFDYLHQRLIAAEQSIDALTKAHMETISVVKDLAQSYARFSQGYASYRAEVDLALTDLDFRLQVLDNGP